MFTNNVTSSLNQSGMFTALRKFLLTLVDVEVIQSQQDMTPAGLDPFITMTTLGLDVMSTNRISYDSDAGIESHARTTRWRCQLDFYGLNAYDMASVISMAFRFEWACSAFKSLGYPVYPVAGREPRQTSFVNSESNFEERWSVDVEMMIDPVVTLPRDFFSDVSVQTSAADTF